MPNQAEILPPPCSATRSAFSLFGMLFSGHMLLVFILLQSPITGIIQSRWLSSTQSPAEVEELVEEAVSSSQPALRRRAERRSSARLPKFTELFLRASGKQECLGSRFSGHRLANGLMAPLRC